MTLIYEFMRKLFLILALLLPLSAFQMRADDENVEMKKIPIYQTGQDRLGRSGIEIDTYYFNFLNCINTLTISDIGEIEVRVTNCSTGETWFETFNSGLYSQHMLQISGTSGFYEIIYITESGVMYEGSFILE